MPPRSAHSRWDSARLDPLIQELEGILRELVGAERSARARLETLHPSQRPSGRNLIHYLAFRRRDLRSLQDRLASYGLSSFGHSESHVLENVSVVLRILRTLAGHPVSPTEGQRALTLEQGQKLLTQRTDQLLGPCVPERRVRIMVTLPGGPSGDPELVRHLMEAGMNAARINCAHDEAPVWNTMVDQVRLAERVTGRRCRILFDLSGPKLRTGPLPKGPAVIKWRPTRDVFGRVTSPARIWLTPEEAPEPPPEPASARLPVPAPWLQLLAGGERIRFTDARKNRREIRVTAKVGHSFWAEAVKTAYVRTGTQLWLEPVERGGKPRRTRVGELPAREEPLRLRSGDELILTRSLAPASPVRVDSPSDPASPARIGCTSRQVFRDVRPGEPIWFDDGKLGGVVEKVGPDEIRVRIQGARSKGGKLRADKGINLPGSHLRLPALTPKDRKDLAAIVSHADLIGYSFVRTPEDVGRLQRLLHRLGGKDVGLVLKIETRAAFERLPELLLSAMRSPLVGVMIARGDLAVECGYERLAEVQEQILWLCEAAHVPVIWATQVLETMARDGQPSRAEVTDAAMSGRAECVMLNKGPEMVATVRALDDILRRMQEHHHKRQNMLRSLNVARSFQPEAPG